MFLSRMGRRVLRIRGSSGGDMPRNLHGPFGRLAGGRRVLWAERVLGAFFRLIRSSNSAYLIVRADVHHPVVSGSELSRAIRLSEASVTSPELVAGAVSASRAALASRSAASLPRMPWYPGTHRT